MNKFLCIKILLCSLFSLTSFGSNIERLPNLYNFSDFSIGRPGVYYAPSEKTFQRITMDNYPELYSRIEKLSAKMGQKMPMSYITDCITYNAGALSGFPFCFVKPFGGILVFGRSLLNEMDTDELDFVIGHELCHLNNRQLVPNGVVSAPAVCSGLAVSVLGFLNKEMINLPYNEKNSAFKNQISNYTFKTLLFFICYQILISPYKRYNEKDADLGAIAVTKNKGAACAALRRLETLNTDTTSNNSENKYLKKCKSLGIKFIKTFLQDHPETEDRCNYIQAADVN